MKRCSTPCVNGEFKIEARRDHYIPIRMDHSKTLAKPMLVMIWNNRNYNSLLAGMQKGTDTLEDSMGIS
jgi:hypothetical protein